MDSRLEFMGWSAAFRKSNRKNAKFMILNVLEIAPGRKSARAYFA
jgi:hypothetical protein